MKACAKFLSVVLALVGAVESRAVPLGTEQNPAISETAKAGAPAVRFENGTLTITAPNEADVRCGQDADGFLLLSAESWERSGNPASANFDAALQGVSAAELHLLVMKGAGRLTVSDLAAEGNLAIEASKLTLTGRVHAQALRVSVEQQLTVEASAHLSAQVGANGGSIFCEAPMMVTGGTFDVSGERAGTIRFSTTNLFHYGRWQADGTQEAGTIAVSYAGKYQDTEGARAEARSEKGRGGRVIFSGEMAATLFSSGTIEATGLEGGTVHLLGGSLKLMAAHIDASGAQGGGEILVGGDKQGANPAVRNAGQVSLNPFVELRADAGVSGRGGKIVVWSDGKTSAAGRYSARGGSESGDGGFIESSGKGELAYGAQADAGAAHGQPGTLLLDPKFIEIKTSAGGGSVGFAELTDPHPSPTVTQGFGTRVAALTTGNVLVTAPADTTNGTSSGAIYLYNGKTGALISSLFGAAAGDGLGGADAGFGQGYVQVSSGEIINLGANAYVISQDANGKKGAISYINGSTGASGTVSSSNSILAITTHQGGFDPGEFPLNNFAGQAPFSVKLASGNYVLCVPGYNNFRGFAMLIDPATGLPPGAAVLAQPSTSNTLIGTNAQDRVGYLVTDLKNGHYLVTSQNWNAGPSGSGACTFCDSATGTVGAVTKANSVVGPNQFDNLGGQITILPNNNYVLFTPNFGYNQNTGGRKGAVTLCSGTTGRPVVGTADGSIDATNTYMGSSLNDQIGSSNLSGTGLVVLSSGNYVVVSPQWGGNKGAVGVGNKDTGLVGVVSATNSLVGHTSGNGNSTFGDTIGSGSNFIYQGVVPVGNGNFVVISPNFNGFRGAVTFVNGSAPLVGDVISSTNSLVGTTGVTPGQPNGNLTADVVGSNGVFTSTSTFYYTGNLGSKTYTYNIANGNYVVLSPCWSGGGDGGFSINGKGAATFGDGNTGVVGEISSGNSLVGTTSSNFSNPNNIIYGDGVGNGITVLSNGNYVIRSKGWNQGRGAYTWGNGTSGITGAVDATNSLVGYSVTLGGTPFNPSIADGSNSAVALSNGNYVIGIPNYAETDKQALGAIVWGDGSTNGTRLVGAIDTVNKIKGVTANDNVGSTVRALFTNGNAFAVSNNFNNGGVTGAGAVTWINGANGHDVTGGFNPISATNSLIGINQNDSVGSGYQQGLPLANGNYLISSPSYHGPAGGLFNCGAVTFCKGDGTTVGTISSANSLIGTHSNDNIGNNQLIVFLPNGNFVLGHNSWNGSAGAVTFFSATTGAKGEVDATNSVIGFSDSQNGIQDQVGYFSIFGPGTGGSPFNDTVKILNSGDFVLFTNNWHSGNTAVSAATYVSGTTGQMLTGFGMVSAANSVVGQSGYASNLGGVEDPVNGNFLIGFNGEGSGHVRYLTGVGTPAPLYSTDPSGSTTLDPSYITNAIGAGTSVVLQANTDVTFTNAVTVTGNGAGTLTVQAGRSILINANITTNNGIVNLIANDVLAAGVVDGQRASGAGVITMANGTTIDTGTAAFNASVKDGAGKTNTTSGNLSLQTVKCTGGTISNSGNNAGSNISITNLQMSGNMTATAPTVTLTSLDLAQKKLTVQGNLAFAASGTFTTDISGTSAGQLGQLAVFGTVSLNSATLDAALIGGFNPPISTTVPIIDNDGADAVSGTFSGLAENALVNINGTNFRVHYADGDGNNVTLVVPPPPEIGVEQPAGTSLTDGVSTVDFGTVGVGSGTDRTFTITNTGGGDLNLTGTPKVAVGGNDALLFSVTADPTSPVAPAGSTTFTVHFMPTSTGTKTASISIDNDDPDENPFTVDLTALAVGPEIAVEQPAGTDLTDGTSTVQFGNVTVGGGTDLTFTVKNTGLGTLNLSGTPVVEVTGSDAAQFTVTTQPTTPVASNGSTTFIVHFAPTSYGPKSAALLIANNDDDENPFDIPLSGTGLAPEIRVQDSNNSVLTDGGSNVDFATVPVGTSKDLVFTIFNEGNIDLTLSGSPKVVVGGVNSALFTVTVQPSSPVTSAGNTTFTVRFAPTTLGPKTATLTIASNDDDENPFDIDLIGAGTRPLAAVSSSVIAQGADAPGAGAAGGPPSGAKLAAFNVPAIDDFGNIAYVAKWQTTPKVKGTGLFTGICLGIVGGPVTGLTGATYKTFSDPVIDQGNVATIATLGGATKGAVIRYESNGTPTVVAKLGDAATPDGAKFKAFKAVDIVGDYTAVFAQLTAGTGTAPKTTAATDLGVWVKDGSDPLKLVLREGQMIAGKKVLTLVSFAYGNGSPGQGRGWLRENNALPGGQVLARVVLDNAQAIVLVDLDDPANPQILSLSGQNGDGSPALDTQTFATYSFPALTSDDRGTFLASLTVGGTNVTKANAQGIFLKPGLTGDYATVLRVGDPATVPGVPAVNGPKFSVLKDPVISEDGDLAFPATLTGGGLKGVTATTLWWKPLGLPVRIFAQGGKQPGPDMPIGTQWKSFPSLAIAGGGGAPIFTGTLVVGKGGATAANANGAWTLDASGAARLLFRTNVTQVGGKTVKSFSLLKASVGSGGVTRSINDSAEVLWLATFTDKTQAIVKTLAP